MDDIIFQICITCGIPKPLDEFYRHQGMSNGRLGKCKECQKANTKLNYRKNIKARKEYDKAREQTEKRKIQKRQYFLSQNEKFPEKRAARIKAGNALRDGRLTKKPCERCGSEKSQMHHPDYSKPLEIEWYCDPCHKLIEANSLRSMGSGCATTAERTQVPSTRSSTTRPAGQERQRNGKTFMPRPKRK